MFEYGFAQALLDQIIGILIKNNFPKLKSVMLGIGPFSKGNFENIKQCWYELTIDSSFEDVYLNKKDIEGKIKCQDCDTESIIQETNPDESYADQEVIICPNCNSFRTNIISGTEIYIVNLEVNPEGIPI